MFYKKLILVLLMPFLFFAFIELVLRGLNIEVNTGMGPLEEMRLFNFRMVNKKNKVDRDIFIETGPKVYSFSSKRYRCWYSNYNKSPYEYRILTLGDSCTYGLEENWNETYSYYLESLLNNYTNKYEFKVFNFGYPGYSSFQGLIFLERSIKLLNPDLIIVWFGANDVCFAPFFSDGEFYLRRVKMLSLVKIHNFLYRHSKFYQLLRNINLNYFWKLVDRSFNNPLERRYKKRRVSSLEFLENLAEMKRICNFNQCKIIFVWHCWFINGKLSSHEEYKPLEPYIDLCNLYQSGSEKVNCYFSDFCHPNRLGHLLIGREIAGEILKIINCN